MDNWLQLVPVPGVVGVVVGCPDGCGGVFTVSPLAAVQTEPATQGEITVTVRIGAEAMMVGYVEHLDSHRELER